MDKKHTCARCSVPVLVQRLGVFNADNLCTGCLEKETAHKDYPRALIANEYALETSNIAWEGLGKPDDL